MSSNKPSAAIGASFFIAATAIGIVYFRILYNYDDEVAKLRAPGATKKLAVEFFGEPSANLSVSEYRSFLLTTDWSQLHPPPAMPDFTGVSTISIFYQGPSQFHIGFDDRMNVKFVFQGDT